MPRTEREPERTYSFSLPPSRSIFMGLSTGEAGLAAGALMFGAIALSAHVPIPLAALPAVLVLVATLRIVRGENLLAWASPMAAYALGQRTWFGRCEMGIAHGDELSESGRSPFTPLPPMPAEPEKKKAWRVSAAKARRAKAERLPIEMRGLSIRSLPSHGQEVGLVSHERTARVVTAVAQVSSTDPFLMLPAAERGYALASFGAVLDGICTEEERISCVSWSERVVPDLGDQADAFVTASSGNDALREDYANLVDRLDTAAQLHEVYLGLSVKIDKIDDKHLAEAEYEISHFFAQWSALNYRVEMLSADDLHLLIQATLEGMPRAYYDRARRSLAVPTAEKVEWSHMQIDGLYHRGYAVQAWPRVPVGSRMLAPVLQAQTPGVARTFTVHWQPTKPSVARRRVRMQVTRAEVAKESRRRSGLVHSARVDREAEDAAKRDEEQTAGYNEHRIAGIGLVSAPSLDLLQSGARRFEQGANRSNLELHPLWGRQRESWVAALPFGQVRFHTSLLEF